MDQLLGEVLDLQKVWQAESTDDMQRRGAIIRREIPDQLRKIQMELAIALSISVDDLGIQGSDGSGQRSEIPWTRVYSKLQSPSATVGWYVVYLFSAGGDRVYLSLNQGTTSWTGSEYKPRNPAGLEARADWARSRTAELASARNDLVTAIHLGARTTLGRGYERGNVVALQYSRDSLPAPQILRDDMLFMVTLLAALYQATDSASYVPGDAAPEVLQAIESATMAAHRRASRSTGQGRLLNADERKAVEDQSLRVATKHFEGEGWSVEDVGAKESYDLLLTRHGKQLRVEVKGTTSDGAQVVLTRSEVVRQQEFAPENALIVVHSITLHRDTKPATASGGILYRISPWNIDADDLTVVSYIYKTGIER